jgi:hypothetical protein
MPSEVLMYHHKDDGGRNNVLDPGPPGRPLVRLKVTAVKIECDAVAAKGSFKANDKVWCIVSVGVGYSYTRIGRHKIGEYSYEGANKIQYPNIALWDAPLESGPYLEFNFWDSEEGEPQYMNEASLGSFRVDVNTADRSFVVAAGSENSTYIGQTDVGDHVIFMHGCGSEYTIQVRVEVI